MTHHMTARIANQANVYFDGKYHSHIPLKVDGSRKIFCVSRQSTLDIG